MGKFIYISIVPLIFALKFNAFGQGSCANTLYEANKSYEAGDFAKSVTQLTPCLKSGFNKDQKVEGYRLLTLSYLALNDPADARKATENMLEQNPLYKTSRLKDPKNFIELVNSIAVIPKFSLGLAGAAGINNTYVNVIQQYNVSNFTKKYLSKIGNQYGLALEYNISGKLEVGIDLNTAFKNYSLNYSTNDFNITDNEHLTFLEVPLYVTYTYGKRRIRPFVRLGAYEDFLLNATSDFSAAYQADKTNYTDNGVNNKDRRNSTDFGLLGSVGLNLKLDPAWQLFVEFRYTYGLTNIVNVTNRQADQDLVSNYFYQDDDLKISNGLFTIGVIRNLNYKVIRQK